MRWHLAIYSLLAAMLTSVAVLAQAPIGTTRGTWSADVKPDKVCLEVAIRRDTGTSVWSTEVARANLAFNPDAPSASPVSFDLKREAGTLAFMGTFANGTGSGQFTFTGDPAYAQQMAGLGFETLGEDEMLRLAMADVSIGYVRDLRSAGYHDLSVRDVVRLKIFGITPELIRALSQMGYANLPARELVRMTIHHVTPEFIREFQTLGYKEIDTQDLVRMRIHGVTADYVREIQKLGYSDVPVRTLVRLRIHDITPEFIQETRSQTGPNVSLDEIIRMKIRGRPRRATL